jgi:hypothetical protein
VVAVAADSQGDMIHKQPIMHSESASPLEASFSPDKQFIIAGELSLGF